MNACKSVAVEEVNSALPRESRRIIPKKIEKVLQLLLSLQHLFDRIYGIFSSFSEQPTEAIHVV